MQKNATLQFWDDFYREEDSGGKEWILQPSLRLILCIANQLSAFSTANTILEIGCGTSSLSADLCEYWNQHNNRNKRSLSVVSTDVSPICIEQQKRRQQQQQQCSDLTNERVNSATLEFRVLDITEEHAELQGRFDMILDKGCLDTCLFRSKQAKQWLHTVLRNIRSWLSKEGIYCIITPRYKLLKILRECAVGFQVQRMALQVDVFGDEGELEPRGKKKQQSKSHRLYMYICHHCKIDGRSSDHPLSPQLLADDDFYAPCRSCGLTFQQFRQQQKADTRNCRGNSYWRRYWAGHKRHCKS